MEDVSWGPEKEDRILIDFLSYTYDAKSHSACKDNQAITDVLRIRGQTNHETTENAKNVEQRISIWTGRYTTNTVRAGTKVEIVRYEKEYRIKQQSN